MVSKNDLTMQDIGNIIVHPSETHFDMAILPGILFDGDSDTIFSAFIGMDDPVFEN